MSLDELPQIPTTDFFFRNTAEPSSSVGEMIKDVAEIDLHRCSGSDNLGLFPACETHKVMTELGLINC